MKRILILALLVPNLCYAALFGYFQSSAVTTLTNVGTSTQWSDCTSLSLTSGDWDVNGEFYVTDNGATFTANGFIGISSSSGNNSSGLQLGDSEAVIIRSGLMLEGTIEGSAHVNYRADLSSTTTIN